MNKDLLYIFDKLTFERSTLGEVQKNFNMSFVIDGTKDSCQMIVWSFSETEIEPYSICYHGATDSWWVVSHDKVERLLNDNGTFIYVHNLELLGAIELLNARDLTDCGFNDRTYTVNQFIRRLVKLSSFEFQGTNLVISAPTNFLNTLVDYVKTFENYTLLSALREFLDGYNSCAKLTFDTTLVNNKTYLYRARIGVISKTGSFATITHNISEFDDVRETKTMDKNSFGTCVVSNAENVISSTNKTFPSTGGVKASGTEYKIKPENAVIRLPSNVYKANWLKIVTNKAPLYISIDYNGATVVDKDRVICCALDSGSMSKAFDTIESIVLSHTSQAFCDAFMEALEPNKADIIDKVLKASSVTLYNGNQLNPVTGEVVKGPNVPYLVIADFHSKNIASGEVRPFIFCDKQTKETLKRTWQGIQWERGSNIISGFDCFDAVTGSQQTIYVDLKYTDLRQESMQYIFFEYQGSGTNKVTLSTTYSPTGFYTTFHFGPTTGSEGDVFFIVNYIPMSDLKLKIDNTRDKRDIQLYNQNGKITDNVALSKLINSYAKEISSDTITRFMCYRSYLEVPKVGELVLVDNVNYIINNVSYDFTQNEKTNDNFGYFIETEITMSKYVSTKSLMVNPNTNIRDYGIPQNFNVKRKQLYRDYYELNYAIDPSADNNYYLTPGLIFTFGTQTSTQDEYVGVIKCTYDESFGGDGDDIDPSNVWYYQLETTIYKMNKMLCIVCDFNDNNIIGYGSQNVFSGFVISRVFSGLTDDLNTPVSYVDSKGQVKNIEIKFCNNKYLTEAYDNYISQQQGGDTYTGSLYNYSVFIPSSIYENMSEDEYTFMISEPNYNKDAVEVPVFEYCCQVNDSEQVLIGDNILTQHDNCIYLYHFIAGENLNQDNVYDNSQIQVLSNHTRYRITASAKLTFAQLDANLNVIQVNVYNRTTYNASNNTWAYDGQINIQANTDLAIFRHAYNLITREEYVELLFIAKNVPSGNISQDGKTLTIIANHWKLTH